MGKILLGIRKTTASYSSNSSEGYSCGTMEASQVNIVMEGTEKQIRDFVSKSRETRKSLSRLSNEIERLEDMENWESIDPVREEYQKILKETSGVNYNRLIMIDGIEL
jgi:carbonic anhydrase